MTPGMTTRHRRAITGNRRHRRTGPSPASLRRPMCLPARNPATGTTSPTQSMTAATTGRTNPRAADPHCGSSLQQALRTLPDTGGIRFVGTRIFPAMTHLYKNFFLLHNFLDLQMVPPSGTPEDLHICASHRHSRDALRSNPILGRVAFFCPFPLPACLSPAPCATPQSGL